MFDHGVVFIVTPCALLLLSTAVQIILDLFPTFSVVCSIAARPPPQQPPPIQMHCGIINSLAGSTVQCPHGVRVYELTILCFYHSIANRSGNCNAGDLAVNKVAGTRSPIPSHLIGRHAEKKALGPLLLMSFESTTKSDRGGATLLFVNWSPLCDDLFVYSLFLGIDFYSFSGPCHDRLRSTSINHYPHTMPI